MSAIPGWVLPMMDSSRGAPMGRRHYRASDQHAPIKFHLVRVPMCSGVYDVGGAYWGNGDPLFVAYADLPDEEVRLFVRAPSFGYSSWRDGAKGQVRFSYPNARFFR